MKTIITFSLRSAMAANEISADRGFSKYQTYTNSWEFPEPDNSDDFLDFVELAENQGLEYSLQDQPTIH